MRTNIFTALLSTAIVCAIPAAASPTTFTYQGRLAQDGIPAEGAYEFEIRLLDSSDVQIGVAFTASEIVTAGVFSMQLDFGNAVFNGSDRYLEISVRSVADGGAYTTLSPNQLVTSTPVAQFALTGNEGPQGNPGPLGPQGPEGFPGTTSWFGLTDIPNDIADGDNDTTYTAGQGLDLSGTMFSILTNSIDASLLANDRDSFMHVSGGAASVNANGDVGLGTQWPERQLHIDSTGNSNPGIMLSEGNLGMRLNISELRTDSIEFEIRGARDVDLIAQDDLTVAGGGALLLYGNVTEITSNLGLDLIAGVSIGISTDRLVLDAHDIIEVDTDDIVIETKNLMLHAFHSINIQTDSQDGVQIEGTIIAGNKLETNWVSSSIGVVSNRLTVGQPTSSGAFDLTVKGTAGKTGGGSWAVFSDARLKKNIISMTGSLDTISALRPVNFEYIAKDHFSYTPGIQSGFIAQEVQQVIPQWVNIADDGYFYLDQMGYEALIVDAIQELRAEKNAENKQLRSENEMLKARLDRLERMMVLSIDR